MKSVVSVIASILLITGITAPAFAVMPLKSDSTRSGVLRERVEKRVNEVKQTVQEKQQETLQERAQREIKRRITALNKVNHRINEFNKITPIQKEAILKDVESEIASLSALQAKINSDTETSQIKADVQSINKSYKVFALYIPKIHAIASADRILFTADKFGSLVIKLQEKITEAQKSGKDVTELQKALTQIQTKLADSKTKANNAITLLTTLTPAGYPSNKSEIQKAKAMLREAQLDLVAAKQIIAKYRGSLGIKAETIKVKPNPSKAITPDNVASESGNE